MFCSNDIYLKRPEIVCSHKAIFGNESSTYSYYFLLIYVIYSLHWYFCIERGQSFTGQIKA